MNGVHDATLAPILAPAKINLYLHVGPIASSGYHPVDSLVVFADARACDRLTARIHPQLELRLEGPKARGLSSGADNLVLRAAQALKRASGKADLGARLTLHKSLPAAAGIGGGSADAAATLVLLNRLWDIGFAPLALETLARDLGSDVPACVRCRPLLMRGAGEVIENADAPRLPAVLITPPQALETRKVFARFDRSKARRAFQEVDPPTDQDIRSFAASLATYRNDLEPVAIRMRPSIARALALLRAEPDCLLARMSGSGPTCFGVFANDEAAESAALSIGLANRGFYVRATALRGQGR
jgi:4-diphosphocytidyl-2-C-methyl-D-erythritol kinase